MKKKIFILVSLISCICIFIRTANTQNVINISNNEGISENPDIEVLLQDIFVVWDDNTTGTFLIYFSKFDGNWLPSTPVSTTIGGKCPGIAVDSDNISIVWQASAGIYYSRYNNNIWSEASFIPGSTGGTFPDISVEDNKMYVVWNKSNEVYFCKYDTNWTEPVKISNSSNDAANQKIVTEDDKVYIIWEETITYNPLVCEIYYARFDSVWSEPVNISNFQNSDSGRPSIGVQNSINYVVWDDDVYSTAAEIFYSSYDDQWSEPLNISNSDAGSLSPSLFVKNNITHVVWYEYISDNLEIIYSNNIDNSWSEPVNISNTPDWSWFPQISANNDSVYIVWTENTFTNSEIYFTGLSFPTTGVNENIGYLYHTSLNNYPNPFSQSTIIDYQLPVSGKFVLKVYNILGHEIRTLVNENQPAGKYSVVWDGTTDTNEPVGSGIYLYQLKAGDVYSETKKMLLIE